MKATQIQTSQSGQQGQYTVQSGDTLYKIASENGMTVQQLMDLNGLTGSTIYVGQSLKLGGQASSRPSDKSSTGGSYTIQSGDTLYDIAKENGTSVGP